MPGRPSLRNNLNEHGYTLVELISVIALSGFLITIATVGFVSFFVKYQELTKWGELQKDAFECLTNIKNGIPVPKNANPRDQVYLGLASAKTIKFYGGAPGASFDNKIECIPSRAQIGHEYDRIRFYFDGTAIRAWYTYGGFVSSPAEYVFPKADKLGDMRVTNFKFTKLNSGVDVKMVRVDLSARITISPKKYRTIEYSTIMTQK